jgi:hypothetical protein
VPLLPLPSSRGRRTTPIKTVFTAAHVQCQKGKQVIQYFQHVCIFCILHFTVSSYIWAIQIYVCLKCCAV